MLIDLMYCVEWDQGTGSWRLMWDEQERKIPAAYYTAEEAEERRAQMAADFPNYKYRVVGYEHWDRSGLGREGLNRDDT